MEAAARAVVWKTNAELQFWFEIYGHIARTGEAMRFEHAAAALGRFFDVYAFRIGAPDQHRVAAIFNDILDRKRAEEALRDSEARLRAIVENLPGGAVFILDRDLRYLLAEGEALTRAGLPSQKMVGSTLHDALPPELAASYEARFRQALAGQPFEHEHEAYGRTYISRGVPLVDAAGGIYAALAVVV